MKKTEMQGLNLCKNTTEKSSCTPVGNQSKDGAKLYIKICKKP